MCQSIGRLMARSRYSTPLLGTAPTAESPCWQSSLVRVPRCEVIGLTSDNVAASWMVALEMRDGSRVRCPFVMPEPLMKIALFGDMRVKARAELAQELGFDSR